MSHLGSYASPSTNSMTKNGGDPSSCDEHCGHVHAAGAVDGRHHPRLAQDVAVAHRLQARAAPP